MPSFDRHQPNASLDGGTAGLPLMSRREMLRRSGSGFGALALAALLAKETPGAASTAQATNPLAPRSPHFAPRAKRAIFFFLGGGPPQLDTFDPKPPATLPGNRGVAFSPFRFQQYGHSGLPVSEVLPELASCVDKLCIIRSMYHEESEHAPAHTLMNCGHRIFSRPSLGSWITYGLGTENQNLPGFVAFGSGPPIDGVRQYSSSFMPSYYQGTFISNPSNPVSNLQPAVATQRLEMDAVQRMNRMHAEQRAEDLRLDSRIASLELAYRMQTEASSVFDLSRETLATQRMYGIDHQASRLFGQQCLLGRRLLEHGVRFVQVFDALRPGELSDVNPWDLHSDHNRRLRLCADRTDRPIAALLKDLEQRGMLEDTLVIWGGEFGRTPRPARSDGSDHNYRGFTVWLAGGGVRRGVAYGATDETGSIAVENRVHIHDLHATILHLLGLDHERLTYRYGGRDYRLTDVAGTVVHGIIA